MIYSEPNDSRIQLKIETTLRGNRKVHNLSNDAKNLAILCTLSFRGIYCVSAYSEKWETFLDVAIKTRCRKVVR